MAMAIEKPRMRYTGIYMAMITPLLLILIHLLMGNAAAHAQGHAQTHERLVRWAKKEGASVHSDVVLQGSVDTGAGIGWFKKNGGAHEISPGEKVLSIPLSLVINIEHALASKELGDVLDAHDFVSDPDALSVFLLHERSKSKRRRKKSKRRGRKAEYSFWGPYLNALPGIGSIRTIMNAEDETMELMQTSSLRNYAEGHRWLVRSTHRLMMNTTSFAGYLFDKRMGPFRREGKKGMSLEKFLWGLSVISSRSHSVMVRDSERKWHKTICLVPMVDMINYGGAEKSNVVCETNVQSTDFVCKATKTIRSGDELLSTYGGHSSGSSTSSLSQFMLAFDYGFTLPLSKVAKASSSSSEMHERVTTVSPLNSVVLPLPSMERGGNLDKPTTSASVAPDSKVSILETEAHARQQIARAIGLGPLLPEAASLEARNFPLGHPKRRGQIHLEKKNSFLHLLRYFRVRSLNASQLGLFQQMDNKRTKQLLESLRHPLGFGEEHEQKTLRHFLHYLVAFLDTYEATESHDLNVLGNLEKQLGQIKGITSSQGNARQMTDKINLLRIIVGEKAVLRRVIAAGHALVDKLVQKKAKRNENKWRKNLLNDFKAILSKIDLQQD